MNFRTALLLVKRALGLVWHVHEWAYDSIHLGGGVFVESRFCGLAACQRYEVRDPLTLAWVERETGGPWI